MHDSSMNKSLIALTREFNELELKILEADGELTAEVEFLVLNTMKDIAHKIDNYDLMVANMKKRSEFYKQKAEEFYRAQKVINNFIDRLKDNLRVVLPQFPNSEIKGEHAYYKLIKSGQKLIIDDEAKLPSKYKITVSEIVPDKELIKSNLEDGIAVEGAHLEDIIQLRSGSVK